MTKKDYELIARAIKDAYDAEFMVGATVTDGIAVTTERIATALVQDNPRFDRARFIKAALG